MYNVIKINNISKSLIINNNNKTIRKGDLIMLNSLFTFIKSSNAEGRRIESNIQSVKEKQIQHDSCANFNQY